MSAIDTSTYIMLMLGGLGVFFFGLKVLSDSLETFSGGKLRKMFDRLTGNKIKGLLVGAGATAVIQSSTAVTVTVVGFVNAGLMTLSQTVPIIMGANIGTTLDALFMALPVPELLSVLAFIGILITMVSKNESAVKVGSILAGLGMIFIGLYLMTEAMTPFRQEFAAFFEVTKNPILLFLIGAVFTALIHSSSAATGILIALAGAGAGVNIEMAIYVILGVNVGTCFTALIASIGTGANAKRAAFIHFAYNFFGAVLVFLLMVIVPVKKGFVGLLEKISTLKMQIAIFHIIFNVASAVVMLPLSELYVKLACAVIPERQVRVKEKYTLTYLNELILSSPSLAVAQVKKEIMSMSELARINLELAIQAVMENEMFDRHDFDKREQKINFLNRKITEYLVRISGLEISFYDKKIIGSYYHVVSDIERIGDYAENLIEYAECLYKEKGKFSEDARTEIKEMYRHIHQLYDAALSAFKNNDLAMLKRADEIEASIDNDKKDLSARHIERLNNNVCSPSSGTLFISIVSDLERVADHMVNISISIKDYV